MKEAPADRPENAAGPSSAPIGERPGEGKKTGPQESVQKHTNKHAKRHGRNVFTIPSCESFIEVLAAHILTLYPDPPNLARLRVFLPTRRACRSLQDALCQQAPGHSLLLPRLLTLGEQEEEELFDTTYPADDSSFMSVSLEKGMENEICSETLNNNSQAILPVMPPLRRLALLARLIEKRQDITITRPQSWALARDLARLLDQAATEGIDLKDLHNLDIQDFAAHWQKVLAFLDIIITSWPKIRAEEGQIEMSLHRRLWLDRQTRSWQKAPPDYPVMVAGSTGSIPATARFIAAIAQLPQGSVILPGVDQDLPLPIWQDIIPAHPQWNLKNLLVRLEVSRNQIQVLGAPSPQKDAPQTLKNHDFCGESNKISKADLRHRLVQAVMAPAVHFVHLRDRFYQNYHQQPPEVADDLHNLQILQADDINQEALMIAMMMRRDIEDERGRTILVTPDRDLAVRVRATMQRWGILVNDSTGRPLNTAPIGRLIRALLQLAITPEDRVLWLAVLKSPLCYLNLSPSDKRVFLSWFEMTLRNDPLFTPHHIWQHAAEFGMPAPLCANWPHLVEIFTPFFVQASESGLSVEDRITALANLLKELCCDPRENFVLQKDEEVQVFLQFCEDMKRDLYDYPAVTAEDFASLFESAFSVLLQRERYGFHPDLAILGPMEARMIRAHHMIVGGANEGHWPRHFAPDPWMSQAMRKQMGLPAYERLVGLAAHDFSQLLAAPRISITRARRHHGVEQVPSRWLTRLQTVLQYEGLDTNLTKDPVRIWVSRMDHADELCPARKPSPIPQGDLRPVKFSITDIALLMRDPYSYYAARILKLRELPPLQPRPGPQDFGSIVHKLLLANGKLWQKFGLAGQESIQQAGLACMAELLQDYQANFADIIPIWQQKLIYIWNWTNRQNRQLYEQYTIAACETPGEVALVLANNKMVHIRARADRIDRYASGSYAIIDYKTGKPPSKKEMETGLAPQLPLEALIAQRGGFQKRPSLYLLPGEIGRLSYWHVTARTPVGEIKNYADEQSAAEIVAQAEKNLKILLEYYLSEDKAYLPRTGGILGEYRDLARVCEWQTADES